MREKAARIFCSISVRLSIWVAAVVAALFAGVLLIFSGHVKKAVKNEAMNMAEQTLMSAVEYTNNTLDKVETVARNMRWTVEHHLDRPDEMMGYCRTVLKYNEELKGCAVAFEPGYYKQKDECFMAYAYRTDEGSVTESNSYGNTPYMTQEWYASIKKEETSLWVEPMPDANNIDEAITSYSMPLHDEQGRFVGVFAIDVSLEWLSATVQQTKPLPHSYCMLLSRYGALLVHPDSTLLFKSVDDMDASFDPTVTQVLQAMLSGETGSKEANIDGVESLVLYRPFRNIGWSVAMVFPEDDIFGALMALNNYAVMVVVGCLLLLFLLCVGTTWLVLQPLRMLTRSARRVADGHFDEQVPDTSQQDEIGHLQQSFQNMQTSLIENEEAVRKKTAMLQESNKALSEAYEQAKEADRVKMAFLHHMTDKMVKPVNNISDMVEIFKNKEKPLSREEMEKMVQTMIENSDAITLLLDQLLEVALKKE